MSESFDESAMLRIHARAAEERIRELTEFVRRLSRARHARAADWTQEARRLVCMEAGCDSAPDNYTPDGRGFCGKHAQAMD